MYLHQSHNILNKQSCSDFFFKHAIVLSNSYATLVDFSVCDILNRRISVFVFG